MRVLIAAFSILVCATCTPGQNAETDEAAIRNRVGELETMINRRDAAGYAELFAPDADLIILDAAVVQGRAAIQNSIARISAATPNRRATITPTAIRFIGRDVAIVNTLARFTVGNTTTEDRGTWLLNRQAGRWMIAALRVMPAEKR